MVQQSKHALGDDVVLNFGRAGEDRHGLVAEERPGGVELHIGEAFAVLAEAAIPVRMTVPRGYTGGYSAVMRSRSPVSAPIARGTRVADLIVTPDGLPPQVTPLLAANDVGAGGFGARLRTGFYRLTGW